MWHVREGSLCHEVLVAGRIMMWLVRIALRLPYTFWMATILSVLLGAASIRNMAKDVVPAIEITVVMCRPPDPTPGVLVSPGFFSWTLPFPTH